MTYPTASCVLHVARDRERRLVGWTDVDGRRTPFSGVMDLIAVVERMADALAPPDSGDGVEGPELAP